MPHRASPNVALAVAIGVIGALTLYAAVSATADEHWLSPWRTPLLALSALWLAAAIAAPLLERRRREVSQDSGDLGCLDRY
jgi:hypothetical protein